jgi:hypothetical protein
MVLLPSKQAPATELTEPKPTEAKIEIFEPRETGGRNTTIDASLPHSGSP